jgi:hypothetical protein
MPTVERTCKKYFCRRALLVSPRMYSTDTLIGTPQSRIHAGKAGEVTDLTKAYNAAQEYWIIWA